MLEKTPIHKPTVKEIEEYMASLNIPMEERFNGTASYDVISKPKHYMLFEDKGIEVRNALIAGSTGTKVEYFFEVDELEDAE